MCGVFGVADTRDGTNDKGVPPPPRSNGKGGRVIGTATAKRDSFAITVDGSTIGVIVAIDLERGATSGETLWSIK